MQRGFLQDKTVVITVAVEQLQVFPVDAFAYGMVVAEIKRRIAHCPDFTGIVRIHVDRQVEIRVYPHQMVFNGSSGSFHARQVKIGMIGGTEQGVAVCLRLIIYTEPIVVRQGIHHLTVTLPGKPASPSAWKCRRRSWFSHGCCASHTTV